ncbi:mucin-2-like, partial [Musca domestica]
ISVDLRVPQKYIIEPVQVITKEGENSEIPPYDEVDFNNEIFSEEEKNKLPNPKVLANSKQPLGNRDENVDISAEKLKFEKSAQKENISREKVENESPLDASLPDSKKENKKSSRDSKKPQRTAAQNSDISSEGIRSEDSPKKETNFQENAGNEPFFDESISDSKKEVMESRESLDTSNTNQDAGSAGLLKTLDAQQDTENGSQVPKDTQPMETPVNLGENPTTTKQKTNEKSATPDGKTSTKAPASLGENEPPKNYLKNLQNPAVVGINETVINVSDTLQSSKDTIKDENQENGNSHQVAPNVKGTNDDSLKGIGSGNSLQDELKTSKHTSQHENQENGNSNQVAPNVGQVNADNSKKPESDIHNQGSLSTSKKPTKHEKQEIGNANKVAPNVDATNASTNLKELEKVKAPTEDFTQGLRKTALDVKKHNATEVAPNDSQTPLTAKEASINSEKSSSSPKLKNIDSRQSENSEDQPPIAHKEKEQTENSENISLDLEKNSLLTRTLLGEAMDGNLETQDSAINPEKVTSSSKLNSLNSQQSENAENKSNKIPNEPYDNLASLKYDTETPKEEEQPEKSGTLSLNLEKNSLLTRTLLGESMDDITGIKALETGALETAEKSGLMSEDTNESVGEVLLPIPELFQELDENTQESDGDLKEDSIKVSMEETENRDSMALQDDMPKVSAIISAETSDGEISQKKSSAQPFENEISKVAVQTDASQILEGISKKYPEEHDEISKEESTGQADVIKPNDPQILQVPQIPGEISEETVDAALPLQENALNKPLEDAIPSVTSDLGAPPDVKKETEKPSSSSVEVSGIDTNSETVEALTIRITSETNEMRKDGEKEETPLSLIENPDTPATTDPLSPIDKPENVSEIQASLNPSSDSEPLTSVFSDVSQESLTNIIATEENAIKKEEGEEGSVISLNGNHHTLSSSDSTFLNTLSVNQEPQHDETEVVSGTQAASDSTSSNGEILTIGASDFSNEPPENSITAEQIIQNVEEHQTLLASSPNNLASVVLETSDSSKEPLPNSIVSENDMSKKDKATEDEPISENKESISSDTPESLSLISPGGNHDVLQNKVENVAEAQTPLEPMPSFSDFDANVSLDTFNPTDIPKKPVEAMEHTSLFSSEKPSLADSNSQETAKISEETLKAKSEAVLTPKPSPEVPKSSEETEILDSSASEITPTQVVFENVKLDDQQTPLEATANHNQEQKLTQDESESQLNQGNDKDILEKDSKLSENESGAQSDKENNSEHILALLESIADKINQSPLEAQNTKANDEETPQENSDPDGGVAGTLMTENSHENTEKTLASVNDLENSQTTEKLKMDVLSDDQINEQGNVVPPHPVPVEINSEVSTSIPSSPEKAEKKPSMDVATENIVGNSLTSERVKVEASSSNQVSEKLPTEFSTPDLNEIKPFPEAAASSPATPQASESMEVTSSSGLESSEDLEKIQSASLSLDQASDVVPLVTSSPDLAEMKPSSEILSLGVTSEVLSEKGAEKLQLPDSSLYQGSDKAPSVSSNPDLGEMKPTPDGNSETPQDIVSLEVTSAQVLENNPRPQTLQPAAEKEPSPTSNSDMAPKKVTSVPPVPDHTEMKPTSDMTTEGPVSDKITLPLSQESGNKTPGTPNTISSHKVQEAPQSSTTSEQIPGESLPTPAATDNIKETTTTTEAPQTLKPKPTPDSTIPQKTSTTKPKPVRNPSTTSQTGTTHRPRPRPTKGNAGSQKPNSKPSQQTSANANKPGAQKPSRNPSATATATKPSRIPSNRPSTNSTTNTKPQTQRPNRRPIRPTLEPNGNSVPKPVNVVHLNRTQTQPKPTTGPAAIPAPSVVFVNRPETSSKPTTGPATAPSKPVTNNQNRPPLSFWFPNFPAGIFPSFGAAATSKPNNSEATENVTPRPTQTFWLPGFAQAPATSASGNQRPPQNAWFSNLPNPVANLPAFPLNLTNIPTLLNRNQTTGVGFLAVPWNWRPLNFTGFSPFAPNRFTETPPIKADAGKVEQRDMAFWASLFGKTYNNTVRQTQKERTTTTTTTRSPNRRTTTTTTKAPGFFKPFGNIHYKAISVTDFIRALKENGTILPKDENNNVATIPSGIQVLHLYVPLKYPFQAKFVSTQERSDSTQHIVSNKLDQFERRSTLPAQEQIEEGEEEEGGNRQEEAESEEDSTANVVYKNQQSIVHSAPKILATVANAPTSVANEEKGSVFFELEMPKSFVQFVNTFINLMPAKK